MSKFNVLIVTSTIFLLIAALYVTATDYTTDKAGHQTLYADNVRGMTTGTVNINDKLTVFGGNLGGFAYDTLDLTIFRATTGNNVQLITRLVRTAAGNDWNTAALQILRRTDVTDQASISLFGNNVGIGTNTPTHKLDVAGDVNAQQLCINGVCKSAWPATINAISCPSGQALSGITEIGQPICTAITGTASTSTCTGDLAVGILGYNACNGAFCRVDQRTANNICERMGYTTTKYYNSAWPSYDRYGYLIDQSSSRIQPLVYYQTAKNCAWTGTAWSCVVELISAYYYSGGDMPVESPEVIYPIISVVQCCK